MGYRPCEVALSGGINTGVFMGAAFSLEFQQHGLFVIRHGREISRTI